MDFDLKDVQEARSVLDRTGGDREELAYEIVSKDRLIRELVESMEEVSKAFNRLCAAKSEKNLRDDLRGELQMEVQRQEQGFEDSLCQLNEALASARAQGYCDV